MAFIDILPLLSNLLRPIVRNFDTHQGFWLVSLTIGLLVIAWRTCIVTSRNDAKRSRPYVILEAMPGIFLGVRLNNVGLTMARNVRIAAIPPIKMAFPNYKRDIKFISKGVDCLSPRMRLETRLGTFSDLQKENPDLVFKGKISYEDDAGLKYSETFVLDYSLFKDITHSSEDDAIASRIQELTREICHLSSGFHQFHVVVDGDKTHRFWAPPTISRQATPTVASPDQQSLSSDSEHVTKEPTNG
jgi:hypothetical protein